MVKLSSNDSFFPHLHLYETVLFNYNKQDDTESMYTALEVEYSH